MEESGSHRGICEGAQRELKPSLKVFTGIPFLKRGKECEKHLPNAIKTIQSQATDIPILRPMVYGCGGKGTQREAVAKSLNVIINRFLETDCTHLWLCNADNEYPEDALELLIRHDVDIVSGISSGHADWNWTTAGKITPRGELKFHRREDVAGKILGENEVVTTGNFCILAKKRVFLRYSDHHEPLRFKTKREKRNPYASELQFFLDAQEMGFTVRIDGRVACGHLPQWPMSYEGHEDEMYNKVKSQKWRKV